MKRNRCTIIILFILVCLFSAACQPAPEDAATANRDDSVQEESVSIPDQSQAAESNGAKGAAALPAFPEQWVETFLADVPNTTVEVNASVVAEPRDAYAVYQVLPQAFPADTVQAMASAITPQAQWYPYQRDAQGNTLPIKTVLEQQIAEVLDWIDNVGSNHPEFSQEERESYIAMQKQELAELQQQYATAVDVQQADIITDHAAYASALRDNGAGVLLSPDGQDIGSFRVSIGKSPDDPRASNVRFTITDTGTNAPSAFFPDPTDTMDAALPFAAEVLRRIGAEDFTLCSVVEDKETQRLSLIFGRTYDGFSYNSPKDPTPLQAMAMFEPQELYEVYWPDEYICIGPGDYGIGYFMWMSRTETGEKLGEVTLLPFEQIQKQFAKYIGYVSAYFEDDRVISRSIIVTDIRLEYKRVPVRDAAGSYMAMPVWTFLGHTMERYSQDAAEAIGLDRLNDRQEAQTDPCVLLIINAVDGSLEG